MLIAARNGFLVGKRILPPGARWVEYLESTGTQYIDTGVVATANNKCGCEIDFTPTVVSHGGTSNANTICVTGANSIAASGFELRWQHTTAVRVEIGGSYGNYKTFVTTASELLNFRTVAANMNGAIRYENSNINRSLSVAPRDYGFVSGSVLLFGIRRNAVVQESTLIWAKMYQAKYYLDSTLVRDFAPIAIGTTGYMLDLLTGEYEQYGNKGTGDFVIGPDL